MSRLTLSSGLHVHVEKQGTGLPVICVPGWAYTTKVFANNLSVIGQQYLAISYDPRSHGSSSRTEEGNDYGQHGRDLADIIRALGLDEFVLLGWSLGVYDIYSYLDQFGFEGVRAVISVDQSPKIIKQSDTDWGEGSIEEIEGLIQLVNADYLNFFSEYMTSGFMEVPDPGVVSSFTNYAVSLTPAQAAGLLRDAADRDYCDLAMQVSERVPVLQMLRKDWSEAALNWIKKFQPKAETCVLGNHLMLYEYPKEFNTTVLNFLNNKL